MASNLRAVGTPRSSRVVMAPEDRPYASHLVGAVALQAGEVTFFAPTAGELEACERALLQRLHDDLAAGTATLVGADRAHTVVPIFRDFVGYEVQAVGWAAGASRYVYLRYRKPRAFLPPLTQEFVVRDGGPAYFELQCNLATTPPVLFNVSVNGEA